jgi:hypothetical protein
MRLIRVLFVVFILGAVTPQVGAQQPATTLNEVINRIFAREQSEMKMLRDYSPLVETYIQNLKPDESGLVPNGDIYFLGRAQLKNGVEVVPFTAEDSGGIKKVMNKLFSMSVEFLPRGFLQMIYVDSDGFDHEHYNLDYVRREFLGEVRCLVFDVTPLPKAGKGRFAGRIWVEDQDYQIVRFNGAFDGSTKSTRYYHFDSWRVNAGENHWFPAFVYTEENDARYPIAKRLTFKGQTRLWGYSAGRARQEQELSKVLVESDVPVKDQSDNSKDFSPLEAQRNWNRQAEDNVLDRMERSGLLAPRGDVDKVLETVINNLEVTNDLDIQPEIRCRLLMTSTLEAFTVGHTIVMSRGLVDVLPDEASLATMLARELSHVVLGHRVDTQYAFFDQLLFDDKETFRHWGFARTPEEEQAAMDKAVDLLNHSPYKEQLATAQRFLQALASRSKEIPNLISPHLGDAVPTTWKLASGAGALPAPSANDKQQDKSIVALPLGGRIKLDPWNNQLVMLKSKPVGAVAENEKMPFEVTPFILYLTRGSSI